LENSVQKGRTLGSLGDALVLGVASRWTEAWLEGFLMGMGENIFAGRKRE